MVADDETRGLLVVLDGSIEAGAGQHEMPRTALDQVVHHRPRAELELIAAGPDKVDATRKRVDERALRLH